MADVDKGIAEAQAAAQEFFTAPYFAVTGASPNPQRFGYKIFVWYIQHGFQATAINPTAAALRVNNKSYPAISDVSKLSNPTQTSLSVVTRPEITIEVLKQAKEVGIPNVWFQTGSYDDKVLEFARANFQVVVAGYPGSVAHDGWCILVDGESAASAAGREFKL